MYWRKVLRMTPGGWRSLASMAWGIKLNDWLENAKFGVVYKNWKSPILECAICDIGQSNQDETRNESDARVVRYFCRKGHVSLIYVGLSIYHMTPVPFTSGQPMSVNISLRLTVDSPIIIHTKEYLFGVIVTYLFRRRSVH